MDRKVSKHLCHVAFRCSREVNDVLPFAKAHCTEEEYRTILAAVANIMGTIGECILEPLLMADPELRSEIDTSIEKYGVFI